MRYLLDARYKTLHSLALTLRNLTLVCERGLSEKLYPTTTEIQETLPLLETYQSAPFEKEEIKTLKDLHKDLSLLVHLPQDVIPQSKETLAKLETLLSKLEPFSLEETEISEVIDEPRISLSKNPTLDLLHNLKIYLQVHILDLEGTAKSIINEMDHINNIIKELKDVPCEEFEGWAQENLIDFLLAAELFQKKDSIKTAEILLQRALDLEFSLQSTREWYSKEIEEKLLSLLELFMEAEESISSEEPLFTIFKEKIMSTPTQEIISKLEDYPFHEDKLKLVADTVLFSYEVLLEEKGHTLASRCRFIDFFHLFSNAIQELYSFFLKAS